MIRNYESTMTELASDIASLQEVLSKYQRIVVLTGAGVSAASGIPTYRDHDGTSKHRNPVHHQEFLEQSFARKRYWARSALGWPIVSRAVPNAAHRGLATLEAQGQVELLITQNVDRLHQRAGSRRVVDLHGRLDEVSCLDCDAVYQRDRIQTQLMQTNPALFALVAKNLPDGDANLKGHDLHLINEPVCERCMGRLMPGVVFFGGGVPKGTVTHCMESLERADALLSIGSSLQVLSGYRFCRRAHELRKPVILINSGITRADPIASLKLTSSCGPLLEQLFSVAERSAM